jgi:hypothetical protein
MTILEALNTFSITVMGLEHNIISMGSYINIRAHGYFLYNSPACTCGGYIIILTAIIK